MVNESASTGSDVMAATVESGAERLMALGVTVESQA
jgi:hypothetical protein